MRARAGERRAASGASPRGVSRGERMALARTLAAGVLAAVASIVAGSGVAARAADVGAVTYLRSAEVARAFAKGAPLVETDAYKVHASRRTVPGMGEVHELDTDIIYVLEGTATFVTGGQLVDAKATATNEVRGASIEGGETRRLVKGDVVIVPQGTPHWFAEVSGTFLYYVVKVTSGGGAR